MDELYPEKKTLDQFCDFMQGAQIGTEWGIKNTKKYVRLANNFHCASNVTSWGHAHFTIKLRHYTPIIDFELEFNGRESQALDRKFGLRELLEESIITTIVEGIK